MKDKVQEFSVSHGESYQKIIDYLLASGKKVFLLEGSVGLGKTTLTSNFVEALANRKKIDFNSLNVMSPTYNIVNEYKLAESRIFHADFYRIEDSPLEVEEILEYIDRSEFSFIEWHEKMADLEPNLNTYVKLVFIEYGEDSRLVKALSY